MVKQGRFASWGWNSENECSCLASRLWTCQLAVRQYLKVTQSKLLCSWHNKAVLRPWVRNLKIPLQPQHHAQGLVSIFFVQNLQSKVLLLGQKMLFWKFRAKIWNLIFEFIIMSMEPNTKIYSENMQWWYACWLHDIFFVDYLLT